jgi:hypothetical protein
MNRSGAIEGPFAWRARELRERDDWWLELDGQQRDELLSAVDVARAAGKPVADLDVEDFPLPQLSETLRRVGSELRDGRGLVLLRGLPSDRLDLDDAQHLLFGVGLHLGRPVSQNAAGDVLGHVRDIGADPGDPAVRLYKTHEPLRFHTDGADATALMCLRPAAEGGLSRIASSIAIYNELRERRPDLAELLFEPFHFDRNEEQAPGQPRSFALPICRDYRDRIAVFYIGWYIDDAQRHPEVPRLTDAQREVMRVLEEIAAEPEFCLEMSFRPGDLQLISNHNVLHSRTRYRDAESSDQRRHLLRLWLALPEAGERAADQMLRGGIPRKSGVTPDRANVDR